MSSVLEFYEQEAGKVRTEVPWFADRQEKALSEFQYRAFPTRKDEDWKYTLLDGFLKTRFSSHLQPQASTAPWEPQGQEIVLANGKIYFSSTFHQELPEGVIVEPLLSVLHQHEDKIRPWLGKLLQNEHGFHALNMAALQSGLFIYLPEGIHLEKPIHLNHWQDENEHALHLRHLIVMEKGARMAMVETFAGDEEASYFTNSITEAQIAAEAELIHYKLQVESKKAYHFGHLAVQQDFASRFESHSLALGAKLARGDLSLRFLAEKAQAILNGIYLPTEGQHIDHHTSVHHLAPSCESLQDYKGVLKGKSRAVFNGKILVGKGAVHTKAQQQNKNLLLTMDSEIDTKPQLEIFADDVSCSHGATVGQLDEDALFYMAARGIDRKTAESFLIQAFTQDNLSLLPDETLAAQMAKLIHQQLGQTT